VAPPQIDFDPSLDYYGTLGVTREVSAEEIKRAYRQLAKQYHPDITGGDKAKEARFKEVQAAYDVLGDARRRDLYDEIRGGGPQRGVYQTRDTFDIGDLGDLFSEFFGQARDRHAAGVDRADFERARSRRRARPRARGPVDAVEFDDHVQAADGSWLRASGSDVYSDVRISFDLAMLGTVVRVATIDGEADVRVPPGTGSGRKLRLRGKGLAGDRRDDPGDHYVVVQIDAPGDLDDESKDLLAQLVESLRRTR
jgi:DnaJ-class molecular chaperone